MPFPQAFQIEPTDPEALLTERQSAQLLNLSIRTLQNWRLQRRGPVWVKCGMAVRYRRRDLLAFVEEGECK